MRIISGIARGRKLKTIDGLEVRPTTDRVKESIFNIIQFDIEGKRVLDLFAGSGSLGIEALSRGAESAVFIDTNSDSIKIVKENLENCRLSDLAQVIKTDFENYLNSCKAKSFDIVFIDPPYSKGMAIKAIELLLYCGVLSDYGIIICKSDVKDGLPDEIGESFRKKRYIYGKTAIDIYLLKGRENK